MPGHPEAVPHASGMDGLPRERLGVRESHEGLELDIEAVQPAGENTWQGWNGIAYTARRNMGKEPGVASEVNGVLRFFPSRRANL